MAEIFKPDPTLVSMAQSEIKAHEEEQRRQRDRNYSKEDQERRALQSFREQTKGRMEDLIDEIQQRGINSRWFFHDHPSFSEHAVTLTTPDWVIVASRTLVRSLRNPDTLPCLNTRSTDLYSLLGGHYFFPSFPSGLQTVEKLMEYRRYKARGEDVAKLCKIELWNRMGWEKMVDAISPSGRRRGRPPKF